MEAPQQSLERPLLRHKGSLSGRGLDSDCSSLRARGTKDHSGRRSRGKRRGRARPSQGRQNPRAAQAPSRRAGWLRTDSGGWRPPTCPSTAAGSWWPPASHVDAPPSPTPAPFARPHHRTQRPASHHRCCRRRPHTGPARGRWGLLNPDRTTAPGRGAQGGPGAWAGAAPLQGWGEAQRAARALRAAGVPAQRADHPLVQWPRPQRAPLPLLPTRCLEQPWDPRAPAPHPLGPRARA